MAEQGISKLRVMLDANVLVANAISPRFPYEVVRHVISGDYRLVISDIILEDSRDAIRKHIPARLASFESLLNLIQYEVAPSPSEDEVEKNADLVRDPDDIYVALAAINCGVDMLVTSDKDFTDPDQPIQQRLKIVLPGAFLRLYMGWTSEALEAIRNRKWADLDKSQG